MSAAARHVGSGGSRRHRGASVGEMSRRRRGGGSKSAQVVLGFVPRLVLGRDAAHELRVYEGAVVNHLSLGSLVTLMCTGGYAVVAFISPLNLARTFGGRGWTSGKRKDDSLQAVVIILIVVGVCYAHSGVSTRRELVAATPRPRHGLSGGRGATAAAMRVLWWSRRHRGRDAGPFGGRGRDAGRPSQTPQVLYHLVTAIYHLARTGVPVAIGNVQNANRTVRADIAKKYPVVDRRKTRRKSE